MTPAASSIWRSDSPIFAHSNFAIRNVFRRRNVDNDAVDDVRTPSVELDTTEVARSSHDEIDLPTAKFRQSLAPRDLTVELKGQGPHQVLVRVFRMSRAEFRLRHLTEEVAQLQGLKEAPLRPEGAIQFGDNRRRLLGRISRSHGENDDSTGRDAS